MEEVLDNLKEKESKIEIKRLKDELRNTGSEPKKKRLKLIDICDKMYRDREEEWRIEREYRELEEATEKIKEEERQKEMERARQNKNVLLDKIRRKITLNGIENRLRVVE